MVILVKGMDPIGYTRKEQLRWKTVTSYSMILLDFRLDLIAKIMDLVQLILIPMS